MISGARAFWGNEDGMTTVEYALLLGLITLASIGAFAALGSGNHNSVTSSVSRISGSMSHAATAH